MSTQNYRILHSDIRLNEEYVEVPRDDFRSACISIFQKHNAFLRLMFCTDERAYTGCFRIYAVFSDSSSDRFIIINSAVAEELSYPSITQDIPAAHWYEREIKDMFGLEPEGHPMPQRLVFHESFPQDSYPLRKDWSISETDLREWSEGIKVKEPYRFMRVEGEGIFEIPVGPVHAGIIEPGHFRFSAIGETIFYLDSRFFYTHKGTEKQFEKIGFEKGAFLSERVSGTSSFSHSSAYCMAVERMCGIVLPQRAAAIRTLLLELERLYNNIGDIGNMCAGTGLSVGYAKGALIKERLMQLNERVTGSRYLRGINTLGGVALDIMQKSDDIRSTIGIVAKEYRDFVDLLLQTLSHIERMETTGHVAKEIARALGITGLAARASGIDDDMRKLHPHLLYGSLNFESHVLERGDDFARMLARVADADSSIQLIKELLEGQFSNELASEYPVVPAMQHALGYVESSRGSLFYWVKSDPEGRVFRVKLRSPSYCNWSAMPFAVNGDIVPDFPLTNKSFNLSYSGCDM
ncbi:MAG: NADH-quinone oxidoreductase subunit C [Dissulfurispiraceae bacterium]|jgi:Ni,Fe-hydrogenase III large subunit/Ni,Fe-hydrogenase III component G|nr:NADH-quinone oxidoreductase subunit C [Dissulfurispiraceae bacterium]